MKFFVTAVLTASLLLAGLQFICDDGGSIESCGHKTKWLIQDVNVDGNTNPPSPPTDNI